MKLFTSDFHAYHRKILKYSHRPFSSVEEMNEELVRRWNSVVGHEDEVYNLGDFCFGNLRKAESIYFRLNGRKFLIRGNHDSEEICRGLPWEEVADYKEIVDQGTRIVLSHYAMRVWNRSHFGALMLYGHSHNSLPGNSQSCDVGVDCWDYTPVTLNQIKERLKTLPPYQLVDHHGRRTEA